MNTHIHTQWQGDADPDGTIDAYEDEMSNGFTDIECWAYWAYSLARQLKEANEKIERLKKVHGTL